MSVRLCVGEYAKNGYEPIHMGLVIHSIEELCFFIRENAYLLDEHFMDEQLILWLEKECCLVELAEELRTGARKRVSLKAFVDTILEYTGFFFKEERKQILQTIIENSSLSVYEKRKARGDALLEKEEYALAGREYRGLLEQLPQEEQLLKGQVYHCCGVCLARLFYFTLAGEYFQKAYEITGQLESFKQYLWSKRLSMTETEYLEFLKEHEEAYEDSLEYKYSLEYEYSTEMEEQLERLKEDWQNSHEAGVLAAIREEKQRDRTLYEQKLEDRVEYLKDGYRRMLNSL